MEWVLKIIFDRKVYSYRAELLPYSNSFEHIRVIAHNKTLIFKSNRPLLKSKGLKHRPVDFKLIQGTVNNSYFLGLIVKSLGDELRDNH